jgi:6-pyruvoyltetrahydropterin/6-carboxytetrahydropterin synthase
MSERLLYCAAAGFEAARKLEGLPEGHRLARLHGHSFGVQARLALPEGWAGFPGGEVDGLRERLARCVAPLDYQLLNAAIASPTDASLARWMRDRLELPALDKLDVRSAPDTGAMLERGDRTHAWRRYAFEAAHRLPNVPPEHKCGRMHGHRFEVVLHAARVPRCGAPGDGHEQLDACWAPLRRELDRACLNDVAGLGNPTSELLASWIWTRLEPELPGLSWVTVHETASCGAHFDGARYRIWKELALDSALRLARAPQGDARRRIHGRSLALRLHLEAPLDEVLGWTVDFGDVKELFAPVFERLDHQPLYELSGVGDNDVASLLRWVKRACASALPALERIDLYESPGCGAILSWGERPPALPI